MSEQTISNEERLYRAFEEHVDPDTFNFACDECLTNQVAQRMGLNVGGSIMALAEHFGVPSDRVSEIYTAFQIVPSQHLRDLPYCLAIAREILGLPPLTDEVPDVSEQPVMV